MNVRGLLARSRAKAGLVAPSAPPPTADDIGPRTRVRIRDAHRGNAPLPAGTVVELVPETVEGVAWIYWLDDRGALHLSHPSFIRKEAP